MTDEQAILAMFPFYIGGVKLALKDPPIRNGVLYGTSTWAEGIPYSWFMGLDTVKDPADVKDFLTHLGESRPFYTRTR